MTFVEIQTPSFRWAVQLVQIYKLNKINMFTLMSSHSCILVQRSQPV